jgi:multidrug efflux system membrane fusion protein
MRLIPVLTALLVMATLYLVVLEREALLRFAQGETVTLQELNPLAPEPAADAVADAEPAPEADVTAPAAQAAQAPDAEPARDAEEAQAVSVVALRSVAREIDSAVRLRGETEAAREVDLRAETSGLVVSEPRRKGALVEAGEVLCRLDPGSREATLTETRARLAEAQARVPEARARLTEAEARLAEAQLNATAAERLSEGGFASETRVASTLAAVRSAEAGVESARSQLESVKANIQSAEAAVESAETEMARLEIAAPFAGLLESDTAELGSLLQPGGLCATVIGLDPIKVVGFVPETEVDRVAMGARAGARLVTGRDLAGEVTFLSRSADPVTRTFRVEITVPNPDLTVRDGQTAEILIEAEGAMAHLLPQSALTLNDAGTLGVRVARDGVARFVPVKLLRDTTTGVWVAGLPDEAAVIVLGQEYVTDGVPVEVTWREATQ